MKSIDFKLIVFFCCLFVVMALFNSIVTYAPSNYGFLPSVVGGGIPVFTIGVPVLLFRTFRRSCTLGKTKYFLVHFAFVIAFSLASGLIQYACLPKL